MEGSESHPPSSRLPPLTQRASANRGNERATSAMTVRHDGSVAGGEVVLSDAVAEALEALQFTLGDGPCVQALETRR